MRGRVAVLLLFLVVSPRLLAQCSFTPAFSAQFRATYLDLAIDGNDLWAATSYGVQLFDRSVDPPALAASIAVPGTTRAIRVVGGIAYAASGSRVYAIRKSGAKLSIAGSVDAGAAVNDVEVTASDLYAATANGLLQFDLINQTAPIRTAAAFPTSSAGVLSVAISGSRLFATDGDGTVEIFSIDIRTLPQRIATVDSLARPVRVNATATRLYVSDGFSTDVFASAGATPVKIASVAYGSAAFTSLPADVVFTAGLDRRMHALDWSTGGSPVELFATDLPPTAGNVNRVTAMAVAGGRLYAAAGDAGLLTWDLSTFSAPFPVRSYAFAPATSTAWADGKLYVSRAAGGISEFTSSASGYLTPARQWGDRAGILQDSGPGFLLASSATSLTAWTLGPTIPAAVGAATFSADVTGAVIAPPGAAITTPRTVAVLADRSVWTADLGSSTPPARVVGASAVSIARSSSGIALADLRDDGSTSLAFYPGGDMTAAPRTVVVQGALVGNLTLSGSIAAVFTYGGITTVDFASGTSTQIPGSNADLARQVVISGERLYSLGESSLTIRDLASGRLIRTLPLPIAASALSIGPLAAMATGSGVMTAALDGSTSLPVAAGGRSTSAFYKRIEAAGDRLYLYDARGVDIFSTTTGSSPHFVGSIRSAGMVDFAASPTRVFTLSAAGIVSAFSRDGVPLVQKSLGEGPTVQMLSISSAGGAPWVALTRKCAATGCEVKTLVLDPETLVPTASLDGAAVDVAESAGRAFAIFDVAAELRSYGISDPTHPSLIAAVPSAGPRRPVAIALSGSTVYVLGEKLSAYAADDLTRRTDYLQSYETDPTVAYVDQRVAVSGSCGVVTGRGFGPRLYNTADWGAATAVDVPSPVRSLAQAAGHLYLLTDHSVEVWTTSAPPVTGRVRAQ